jgi:hypothetical protein
MRGAHITRQHLQQQQSRRHNFKLCRCVNITILVHAVDNSCTIGVAWHEQPVNTAVIYSWT